MKNFFTSFFATLTALIVFALGGMAVCFLFLAAMAAMGGQKQPVGVPAGSYLVVSLSTNIQDSPSQVDGFEDFAEIFGGNSGRQLQLREVTRALQAAAKDGDIKGIYLTGSMQVQGYGSGYAALKEVRMGASEPVADSGHERVGNDHTVAAPGA